MRCVLWSLCFLLTLGSLARAEESAVTGGYLFSSFEEPGEWRPAMGDRGGRAVLEIVSEPCHEGKGALRLSYDFTGATLPGGYYARARISQGPVGAPERFTLWVHGDGSRHPISFRFRDRHGEIFQTRLALVDWTGWRKVEGSFAPEHRWGGSGGEAGVPEPPLTFWEIFVDHAAGTPERGAILFDEMRITTRIRPEDSLRVKAPSDPMYYTLVGKRQAEVALRLENLLDRPQRAKVRWRLSAFLDFGDAREDERSVTLPAQGHIEAPFRFALPDRGYYEARVTIEGSEGSRASLFLPFAAIDPPVRTEIAPDSPFGINGHTPDRQALEMMKLAGIRIFRGDMNWVFFEPEEGRFHADLWDRITADARDAKVLILPVVGYAPEWAAAPLPPGRHGSRPRDPKEYASLLERLVTRYRDTVRVWDLWNEPDLTWSGTPEEYGQTVALAIEAIRRADPKAAAMLGGCADGDINSGFRAFTEAALKGLGMARFDVFSVHPYSRPRSPEEGGLRRKLESAVRYVEAHGGKRPVWVTEIGWPTADDSSSVPEPLQAAYLVRSYVLALSVPGVEKVFWYQLFSGESRRDPEAQYGILRAGLLPKPSYAAYAHMTHQLEGARFLRALDLGGIAQGYAFRRESGEAVAVLWSAAENVGLDADLPRGTQGTQVDGHALKLGRRDPLPLSATPLYVRFPKGSEERRLRSLEAARLVGGTPLSLEGGLDAEGRLAVRVTNRMRKIVACQIGARAEGSWGPPQQESERYGIASGGTLVERMRTDLPAGEEPARSSALVVAQVGDEFVSAALPLRLMTARRLAQPLRIDGDLGEWEGIPALALAGADAVAPASARGSWSGPEDLSARIQWAWDPAALYLCVRVTDDRHSQEQAAKEMWQGDSLQVAFDPECDTWSPGYDGNDSEVGLGLVAGGAAAYRWAAPKGRVTGPAPGITTAIRRQGTETCYEAAFPWDQIAGQAKEGGLLAVCVLVNDNDGAGRKLWMETSPGIGELKDPRGFWRLRLSGTQGAGGE